jgi:hypothetical protein
MNANVLGKTENVFRLIFAINSSLSLLVICIHCRYRILQSSSRFGSTQAPPVHTALSRPFCSIAFSTLPAFWQTQSKRAFFHIIAFGDSPLHDIALHLNVHSLALPFITTQVRTVVRRISICWWISAPCPRCFGPQSVFIIVWASDGSERPKSRASLNSAHPQCKWSPKQKDEQSTRSVSSSSSKCFDLNGSHSDDCLLLSKR